VRPAPLSQDELLGLFASDTVGRNVVLQPASLADMMGADVPVRQSLEVVYETV
jgi:chlorophyllide a reductase subunit X